MHPPVKSNCQHVKTGRWKFLTGNWQASDKLWTSSHDKLPDNSLLTNMLFRSSLRKISRQTWSQSSVDSNRQVNTSIIYIYIYIFILSIYVILVLTCRFKSTELCDPFVLGSFTALIWTTCLSKVNCQVMCHANLSTLCHYPVSCLPGPFSDLSIPYGPIDSLLWHAYTRSMTCFSRTCTCWHDDVVDSCMVSIDIYRLTNRFCRRVHGFQGHLHADMTILSTVGPTWRFYRQLHGFQRHYKLTDRFCRQ